MRSPKVLGTANRQIVSLKVSSQELWGKKTSSRQPNLYQIFDLKYLVISYLKKQPIEARQQPFGPSLVDKI